MPPVTFSTAMVTRQHREIVPGPDLHEYMRFDSICNAPHTSSARITPEAQHHDPPSDQTGEARGEAEHLGDVGDLDLGEAERDVERVRHHPGERVAEFVEHDEDQDRPAPRRASACRRRAPPPRAASQAAARARRRAGQPFGRRIAAGLAREQHGRHADQHQRRHCRHRRSASRESSPHRARRRAEAIMPKR